MRKKILMQQINTKLINGKNYDIIGNKCYNLKIIF